MEITVQYLEGCPNVGVVFERLAAAGVDPDRVRLVKVSSPELATLFGFRGSPTVLVNDGDFTGGRAPAGYVCRVYRTESGLKGAHRSRKSSRCSAREARRSSEEAFEADAAALAVSGAF